MPHMTLERQYSGPLQDTIVQRWRDPVDGSTCYIYLPINAQHSPPTATGYVQYGANTIGSISCIGPRPAEASARQTPSNAAPDVTGTARTPKTPGAPATNSDRR